MPLFSHKFFPLLVISSALCGILEASSPDRGIDRSDSQIDKNFSSEKFFSSVDRYIINAFDTDPLIKSNENLIESQKFLAQSLKSYESPEINIQLLRTKPDMLDSQQEYGVTLTQLIEKPSLRNAKKLAQDAKVLQMYASLEVRKSQLAGQIIQSAYILQASQALLVHASQALQGARLMKQSGEVQYKEGVISQAALMKITVEEQRILSEYNAAQMVYLQAKRDFAIAAKISLDDVPKSLNLPALSLPSPTAVEFLPMVSYHEALYNEAKHNYQTVSLSAIPGVKAGIGFQKSYDQTSLIASVSLPLPVWKRSTYNEQAANFQSHASWQELQEVKIRLAHELSGHYEAVEKTKLLIDQLDQTVTMSQKMQAYAQKSYESGYGTMLELLDAKRVAIKAQTDKLQAMIDLYRHAGEIIKLTPYHTEKQ